MAIKIVVVDSAQLPACVDFPPLEVAKLRVDLLTFPSTQCKKPAAAVDLCQRIPQAVDHYIRNSENKGVLS